MTTRALTKAAEVIPTILQGNTYVPRTNGEVKIIERVIRAGKPTFTDQFFDLLKSSYAAQAFVMTMIIEILQAVDWGDETVNKTTGFLWWKRDVKVVREKEVISDTLANMIEGAMWSVAVLEKAAPIASGLLETIARVAPALATMGAA